tara:strand:- start:865 stop:1065 length:201 start_codon:yes stop_codon:yes gene_type:complete
MDDSKKTPTVVVLPEGSKVPADVEKRSKIIGFVREDGSILLNQEGKDDLIFSNMSQFFKYVGEEND